jgi:hypothetical protein
MVSGDQPFIYRRLRKKIKNKKFLQVNRILDTDILNVFNNVFNCKS